MSIIKKLFAIVILVALGLGGYFVYLHYAFPEVRCEAFKHLEAPEKYSDCASCHALVTKQHYQDWYDSKHGVMLVKCFVCHGLPDGSGAIPFNAKPGKEICARCHAPAIEYMEAKFGKDLDCSSCHPRHERSVHSNAYQPKTPAKKDF